MSKPKREDFNDGTLGFRAWLRAHYKYKCERERITCDNEDHHHDGELDTETARFHEESKPLDRP